MIINPNFNKVLLEENDINDSSGGGILLSENTKIYKIVSIGDITKDILEKTREIYKGDLVICSPFSGDNISLFGKNYKLVSVLDILGIIS